MRLLAFIKSGIFLACFRKNHHHTRNIQLYNPNDFPTDFTIDDLQYAQLNNQVNQTTNQPTNQPKNKYMILRKYFDKYSKFKHRNYYTCLIICGFYSIPKIAVFLLLYLGLHIRL